MQASDVTSVNISWNFRFSKFAGPMEPPIVTPQRIRGKFDLRFGATNRMPQPRSFLENTVRPNEFTDFENFGFQHPGPCKMIFHVNLAKTPRYRYYAYNQPLYESYLKCAHGPTKQWNSHQRRKCTEIANFRHHQRKCFMKFSFFEISRCHRTSLNPRQRLRCKFVMRFGATNRNLQPKKTSGKYNWTKRIHRCENFGFHNPRPCKNDFCE